MSDAADRNALTPLPSIGGMVHYWDGFGPYDHLNKQVTPKAATVTYVHSPTVVDLTVFYPSRGGVKQKVRVRKAEEVGAEGRWTWPERRA